MNNRSIDGELMNIIVRSMTLGQIKNFDKRVDGYDKVRQQIKSLIGKRLLGEIEKVACRETIDDIRKVIKDVLNIEGE